MANKRNREIWAKEEKQRKYEKASKGLSIYPLIALALTIAVLILFLIKWAGVYNTSPKVQDYEGPKFTGVQLLVGAFSGDYETITDDNGIGLYYYFQKDRTVAMGVFGVIALFSALAGAILSIITAISKKHFLNIPAACCGFIALASLVACYVVSLNAGYPLMVGYKCDLTVCRHMSYIIIPAIVSLLSVLPSVLATVKYFSVKKLLK